ncbi:cysteine desulfurase family protein [Defluviitalea phaphyphila]|uniref:cysteine desulfurase family protein n=1 Tax=Defluviitalea phaphyphila TaxID=1473580 RepID=UPI00072FAD88|nr:cysteine desulfurase family protein [Defluviitalea phaphyphila]
MKEIYFDNAATTKVSSSVVKKMIDIFEKDYGNPSSLHIKGVEAEKYIKETTKILSSLLNVSEDEIFYTSGGTESNNLSIIGTARAYHRRGKHIIVSKIEHPSVYRVFKYLEEEGFEVSYVSVDSSGYINEDELKQLIRQDTILVSILHVNNEIGTIQNIDRIGKIIKSTNKNTIFHVDAVQSFGKIKIPAKKWNIDLLSISSHKFHGPKGIGALYKNKEIRLKPLIFGGNQQKGLRSGTENVPGIAGLGIAAKNAYDDLENINKHLYSLKNELWKGIKENISDVYINGPEIKKGAPHILNIRFDDIRGEVLLHALEAKKIYVSTGSACSSNQPHPSDTLMAIGLDNKKIQGSVRFSFSKYNTLEEVELCVQALKEIVSTLRMFK